MLERSQKQLDQLRGYLQDNQIKNDQTTKISRKTKNIVIELTDKKYFNSIKNS